MTSDGGLLLLREIDRSMSLSRRVAALLPDFRDPARITHTQESMIAQRILALALGYEDLNDHHTLRHDLLLQSAAGVDHELASAPTLCRLENRADARAAYLLNQLLVDVFIESHQQPPEEIILDFDATDDRIHGRQEGRHFHGYYDSYCFLPLYVFCGDQPLVAWLRPADRDAAQGALAVLRLLVRRLRAAWPETHIIWRADSGFCRWKMLRWSEANGVDYIVGLAKNKRLLDQAGHLIERAGLDYERAQSKIRHFSWMHYGAQSWDRQRLVIAKAEHSARGSNPRFIVTSLRGDARALYDQIYCARGDMENRIKEQQLGLFADRTSCHKWWPNQLRLLMSTFAYILLERLRGTALAGTQWAKKQASTLRAQFLKIGAIIIRNTRRVKVHLSSAWPWREDFKLAWKRLCPG